MTDDERVMIVLRMLGAGGTMALARDIVAATEDPEPRSARSELADDLAGVAELAEEFGASKVQITRMTERGALRVFRQLRCGPIYLISDARQSIGPSGAS